MRIAATLFALCLITSPALAQELTAPPPGATAYIIAPADGATVTSPFTVRFGLHGMGVAPAGVDKPKTGHHHLLIDTPLPPLDENIPSDDQHRHFGGGQTEVELSLPPGKHSLQLLLGDQNHIPFAPSVQSEIVTVTVE